ncbi:UDP-N-acetylmuramoyl-tripeptide--D-alanyl-D-alanine ligase [Dinghuibacter silviterrae]|nr:UDP-N-acetylmuramoyl-tripeptide--D-alanyl-D-alanine ligase [Dinghuibacter silviterrae]
MTIPELYALYQAHPSVQTDTRRLVAGDLFFALKGPNFNANLLAPKALEDGASYAVVDETIPGFEDPRLIRVADVLDTLQQLAKHHREHLRIPVLAITGSNGKTTTKELIHAVLSTTYKTSTTQGNLNNHIGVPLTMLRIPPDAELAVIEMGANHIGEIAGYCTYALPTHGLITNTGKAHLEGFGSLEGVRRGKGELYDHLRANDRTAFIMWDYDYLREMSNGIAHRFTYGTIGGEDLTGTVARNRDFLEVSITNGAGIPLIKTKLVGDYNLPNVLAAVAVGKYFEVHDEHITAAIEAYTPTNSRSQMLQRGTNHIILDAYNANPSSMAAAIDNFARMDAPDKVLMLGGMKELGPDSVTEHQHLVDLIGRHPWKAVALVGGDFAHVNHPYAFLGDTNEARTWLAQQAFNGATILIKGSRGIAMENVLES